MRLGTSDECLRVPRQAEVDSHDHPPLTVEIRGQPLPEGGGLTPAAYGTVRL